MTGLNRSTVTRLVDELIDFGIVSEGKTAGSNTGGRPLRPLYGAQHSHVAIGIEISKNQLELILMDLRGDVLALTQKELPVSELPARRVLESTAELTEDLIQQVLSAQMSLAGISIGLPGLIDKKSQYLLTAPNFGWQDIDLLENFRNTAKLLDEDAIPITFENSAALTAFNELIGQHRRGAQYEDFLLVTGNSGVGSSLVRQGKVIEGTHGWAGELGHMFIRENSTPCSCGMKGCLESFISLEPLLQAAGLSTDSPLAHLKSKLRRRDKQASRAVKLSAQMLGRALSNYINIVDVRLVILSGIYGSLFEYILPEIEKELESRVISYRKLPTQVQKSQTQESAVAKGAAWKALLDFVDNPKVWTPPTTYARNFKGLECTNTVTLTFD
ncbi:ROK family protein [Corynebacterium glucuronolyticum]|uniref:ROK family protein n=1 Tax=Corynebacterium glucuronolyticum TaxID=39791 RepID=UPI00223C1F34|nr:ROK family protein [Corynebacterium glucuronolyticum]MCT1443291.1 ROK family protein [Corynebacterium glucuronolyticum]